MKKRTFEKRGYAFIHRLAWLLSRWLCGVEVRGKENIPKSGAVIITSNHLSYLDPILIGSAVDAEINYMAKSTLFLVPIIGGFLRYMNAYPVKRGAADRAALKRTLALLKEGKSILIFPEGTRGMGHKLGEAKDGVGFLVYHSEALVIPALIKGSQNAWGRGQWFPRRAKVTISFGKSVDLGDLRKSASTREVYAEIGKRIMRQIADLSGGLDLS